MIKELEEEKQIKAQISVERGIMMMLQIIETVNEKNQRKGFVFIRLESLTNS